MTWLTLLQFVGLLVIFYFAIATFRSARKLKVIHDRMEKIYGKATSPLPPKNIQFHLPDGRTIPVDATLESFEFIWIVHTEFSPDQVDHVTIEGLPPHTRVEVEGPKM